MTTYRWIKRIDGEVSDLDDLPTGAWVSHIDDVPCVGNCEACGKPVAEWDRHFACSTGVVVCESCGDPLLVE